MFRLKMEIMAAFLVATGGLAQADVFNMGSGITSLETVPVGNAGNAPDTRYNGISIGAVPYNYSIGKYEVTAGQYCAFLNAVGKTDPYGLYNTSMWSDARGCKIQRNGSFGGYVYSVASDYSNRPVNYVSWGDSARFVNWLTNGQPVGEQGPLTTEDGTYALYGATSVSQWSSISRTSGNVWVIPNEDEWYKAAFHKNDGLTGNYFDYPTSSNIQPSNSIKNPDSGNNANYYDITKAGYFYPDPNGFSLGFPYYRTVVGEFENSRSPYGTFDQGGNVWERIELPDDLLGVRGGAFDFGGICYLHAMDREVGIGAGTECDEGGFRVAFIGDAYPIITPTPEPGTLALLALGGVALLIRKRRPAVWDREKNIPRP